MTAEVITYRPRSAVRDVGKALGLSLDRVDRAGQEPGQPSTGRTLRQPLPAKRASIPQSLVGGQLVRLVARTARLSPASCAARRRHGHHARAAVRTGADRKRRHGRPHRHRVGQGRSGRAGHPESRLPGPGHAHRHSQVLRPGRAALRPQTDAGHDPAGGPGGLRHDLPGRHDRRVSDRKPGPDEHAAAAAAALLLRPGDRSGHRPPRPDPGKHGASLSAAPRRRGSRSTYPNDAIRGVLEKTLGVPLFQEQAMRLAVVAAGFTPGEADQLRRAMGAWRRPGVIEQFRQQAASTACWPAGCRRRVRRTRLSSRFAVSANMAFPNRTPPASRCWSMSRPG